MTRSDTIKLYRTGFYGSYAFAGTVALTMAAVRTIPVILSNSSLSDGISREHLALSAVILFLAVSIVSAIIATVQALLNFTPRSAQVLYRMGFWGGLILYIFIAALRIQNGGTAHWEYFVFFGLGIIGQIPSYWFNSKVE
jgi:hypothetical protein